VGVPSNRHGRAMAVAKSFNKKITLEGSKMDKEFTKTDLDTAIDKKVEEINVGFSKKLEEKDVEISKLQKDLEKSTSDMKAAEETAKKSAEEAVVKQKSLEEDIKKVKDEALEKQRLADNGGDDDNDSDEKAEKAMKEGKLPIMHM
ncbi:hypothetical protein KAU11_09915, partial [Candidatus Babeliales bacterium]|nr:hypothetical protein [Candidatus Babeliales bacterium]